MLRGDLTFVLCRRPPGARTRILPDQATDAMSPYEMEA